MRLTAEQQRLALQHVGLAAYIAGKFYRPGRGTSYDDLKQVGLLAVCHAAATYRDGQGTFGGYVGTCCWRAIRDEVIRHRRWLRDVSESTPVEAIAQPEPSGLPLDDRIDLTEAIGELGPTARMVLSRRLTGCLHREIAAELGCTRANVTAYERQSRKLLRRRLSAAPAAPADRASSADTRSWS